MRSPREGKLTEKKRHLRTEPWALREMKKRKAKETEEWSPRRKDNPESVVSQKQREGSVSKGE